MNDRILQSMFKHKLINLDGIIRSCYYCTLEDGGAWIWLRNTSEENYKDINFIVYHESTLADLFDKVCNMEKIITKDFGYIHTTTR